MPASNVLVVTASARARHSLSRGLADNFVTAWEAAKPDTTFVYRDVGLYPPPFVSEAWVAAAFTPPGERNAEQMALLRPSDEMIDEVIRADIIVMATPMYNYGMPAALKAWFDQVIRIGKTFTFDLSRGEWPLEPTLEGKNLVVLSSKGEFGYAARGMRQDMKHLDPHIKTASRYLGVEQCHFVAIEYQEFGDQRHHNSIERAHAEAAQLAREMAGGDPVDSRSEIDVSHRTAESS